MDHCARAHTRRRPLPPPWRLPLVPPHIYICVWALLVTACLLPSLSALSLRTHRIRLADGERTYTDTFAHALVAQNQNLQPHQTRACSAAIRLSVYLSVLFRYFLVLSCSSFSFSLRLQVHVFPHCVWCVHACICVCVCVWCKLVCMYACMHTCVCGVLVCRVQVRVCMCVHACSYECACLCVWCTLCVVWTCVHS